MKSTIISVVVPIYMIDRYLGICIESLLNQTYKDLEIILVDDGSKDRCSEICDLYASKDSRIKVIHKSNGGLVSARKAGVLAATGRYIGFVDGDDWVGPGFYQSLYNAIIQNDCDVAIAGFSRDLFSRTQSMYNTIPSGYYEGETLKGVFKEMISYGEFYRHGISTYHWNKLFKREVILKHQLEIADNVSIGEDAVVVYATLLDCKRICITDNCAYHYRQREDSMLKSSVDFDKEMTRVRALYENLSKAVMGHPIEYDLQRQVDDFITGIFIIRSGGCVYSDDEKLKIFPFGKSLQGKKIVLYGGGTFGQQLMKRLVKDRKCEVVGWVDDDYWEYRRCCLNVDSVESIIAIDYDYVVVASLDRGYTVKVINRLKDFGISEHKIIIVNTTKKQRTDALKAYLKK
jgi:glycosyltransferase involved in cell wall biosynthesis